MDLTRRNWVPLVAHAVTIDAGEAIRKRMSIHGQALVLGDILDADEAPCPRPSTPPMIRHGDPFALAIRCLDHS